MYLPILIIKQLLPREIENTLKYIENYAYSHIKKNNLVRNHLILCTEAGWRIS